MESAVIIGSITFQVLSGGVRRSSVAEDGGAGGESESTGAEVVGVLVVLGPRDISEFKINANPLICVGCSKEILISIFSIPFDDVPRRIAGGAGWPSATEAAGMGTMPRRLRAGIAVRGN